MNFAPPAVELKARLVLRGSCAFLALLMVNICLYFVWLDAWSSLIHSIIYVFAFWTQSLAGRGGGVYLESYTREVRFLMRWDQHAEEEDDEEFIQNRACARRGGEQFNQSQEVSPTRCRVAPARASPLQRERAGKIKRTWGVWEQGRQLPDSQT
jgi:hypothetical protein